MSSTYYKHVLFEVAVYKTFPIQPIPNIEWDKKTTLSYQAVELLNGRTWPEVIGCRLNWAELDVSLSMWFDFLPNIVCQYYLPSHLIYASMSLAFGKSSNHSNDVMEAMILAPSNDDAQIKEIDRELNLEAKLSEYCESRAAMYWRMDRQQRSCVAQYLSLYLEHHPTKFKKRALELFLVNQEIWQNSLL